MTSHPAGLLSRSPLALRLLLVALWGCGPAQPTEPVAADAVQEPATACSAARRRPDQGCCAPGSFHEHTSGTCRPVGPANCAAEAIDDPAACQPRWCSDLLRPDGSPCQRTDEECERRGRACSAAELSADAGCPAGMAFTTTGGCANAGSAVVLPGGATLAGTGHPLPQLPPPPALGPAPHCGGLAGLCEGLVPLPAPCPSGFRSTSGAEQPPPCEPDPGHCSPDPWGDQPALPTTLHVDPAALPGGDGGRDAPLVTLAEAVAAATPGATILLAPGTHAGGLLIGKSLTLHGHCAADVRIVGLLTKPALVIGGAATLVKLLGLSVIGGVIGVQVVGAAKAELHNVRIRNAMTGGLFAESAAQVTLRESLIEGTLPTAGGQLWGYGIMASTAALLTVEASRISANHSAGVVAADWGTTVALTGVLIDGTRSQPGDGEGGYGVVVTTGASLVASRLAVLGNRHIGLAVIGAKSRVTAARLLIAGTRGRSADHRFGRGLDVEEGAQVELHDARVADNREVGVHVEGPGSRLWGTDLLVDGTDAQQEQGSFGRGLVVINGATAALARVRLSANRDVGLSVVGANSVALLDDLLIDGTRPELATGTGGWGASVEEGARLRIRRGRVSGNRDLGLMVMLPGSHLAAADLAVHDTLPQLSDGKSGRGIEAQNLASLVLAGAVIADNHEIGLHVSAAQARLAGVIALDTRPRQSDGVGGAGIYATAGANLDLGGSLITGNHAAGVAVHSSSARLLDVVIRHTGFAKHVQPSDQPGAELGDGLLATLSQKLWVERTLISANLRSGLLLHDCQDATVRASAVSGSPLGLVTQGQTKLTLDGALLHDNSISNRAGDAGLSVPPPPVALQ